MHSGRRAGDALVENSLKSMVTNRKETSDQTGRGDGRKLKRGMRAGMCMPRAAWWHVKREEPHIQRHTEKQLILFDRACECVQYVGPYYSVVISECLKEG